jgi:tellurite resistance protein TehA-like permease
MAAGMPVSLERVAAAMLSGAAAPVMGTGIVSVALELDGERVAADALLVVAAALGAVLVALLVVAARRDPRRVATAANAPGSLTMVAAACVLGSRLTQGVWRPAAFALLGFAVTAWAPLLYRVLRAWRRPCRGDGFLVGVATQAIGVLCAALGGRGLAAATVVALAAGLGLYAFAAASFDLGELRRGRGDQWVAAGALAIAALAAGTAAEAWPAAGPARALQTVSLALWALATAWLPVLVAGELLRPRSGFDPRRWSTVFPVGMYAAMSHVVGHLAGRPAIVAFGRAWTWAAVAVWAIVALASARRAASLQPVARRCHHRAAMARRSPDRVGTR